MMQVVGFLSVWLRTHGCLNVVPTSYFMPVTRGCIEAGSASPNSRWISAESLSVFCAIARHNQSSLRFAQRIFVPDATPHGRAPASHYAGARVIKALVVECEFENGPQ